MHNADSSLSSEVEYNSDGTPSLSAGRTRAAGSPKRRSQRQIDRQEQEELRKIRAENEQLLKKEKESMTSRLQKKDPATGENEPAAVPVVAVSEPTAVEAEETKPPVSRAVAIRQKLQKEIMSVDPVARTPKSVDPFEPKFVPGKRQADGAGGVARPRRENRQPPKHLRDAFNQLEFEAATTIKKTPSSPLKSERLTSGSAIPAGANGKRYDTNQIPAGRKADKSVFLMKSLMIEGVEDPPDEVEYEEDVEDEGEDDDDDEEGEEEEDEDLEDPDRLWCICREPHNNRFMICCDKCEDWFHGTCVGVTRAMGRELENKGLDWICPRCVRQEYAAANQGQLLQVRPFPSLLRCVELGKLEESLFLSPLGGCARIAHQEEEEARTGGKECGSSDPGPRSRPGGCG